MVVAQSPFPPRSRPQSLESSSLPPNFHCLPGSPFVTSLHPYFIPSSAATQHHLQPLFTHSLAHTFHCTGGVLTSTPIFEFPISNFVFSTASATPLSVTLTDTPQLHENKTTLSPAFATLTHRVKPKSFVCHSYRKHRGVGYPSLADPASFRSRCFTPANGLPSRFLPAHSSLFSLFHGKREKLIPFLSCSSALFKKECCDNSFPINSFHTLWQNTGGGTLSSALPSQETIPRLFRFLTIARSAARPCVSLLRSAVPRGDA
jgi:hypothetical protein